MLIKSSQQGLSLIESMVSLLIISIGLLGIASLQINAMKLNSSAYWHSQAIMAAHNMADRVRANKDETNNYIGIDTSDDFAQDCLANACTPAQMRLADATDWGDLLTTIPLGRGIIRAPDANQLDIVVLWDDAGTGATGTECGNDPDVDLSCYVITMRI